MAESGKSKPMPSRICSTANCPTIHEGPGSRCPTHAKVAKRAHWDNTKAYNTKAHRITFRLGVLDRDPICVLCNVRASVVADHYPHGRADLVALALDANDPANGRGLCTQCDKTQTAQRQPGGWHKATEAD